MKRILEIACFNLKSALIAQNAGADRIELCSDYKCGGITPSHHEIEEARKLIQIPLHVIIRPRAGNFVYSEAEQVQLKESILFCKEKKVNGIVFGVLNTKNEINTVLCKHLIELAKPMHITFHRAIDACLDKETQISKLIDLGVDGILTSGGQASAMDGALQIKDWQLKYGRQIKIMPGGGLRSGNVRELIRLTQCNEYHSAAIVGLSEIADAEEIKRLRSVLHQP